MNNEVEAKIEFQEVIGEANEGGYQPIRFSRVKYKASPDSHIDIRQFQRGYKKIGDDEEVEAWFPTKKGFRFPEREFRKVIAKYTLVPRSYVHPLIVEKCFGLLDSGELESAVLQAFKLIETKVRKVTNANLNDVGVNLLRKAFHPDTGSLTDDELPRAEREGILKLYLRCFCFLQESLFASGCRHGIRICV